MIPELQQLLSTGIVKQDKWAQVGIAICKYTITVNEQYTELEKCNIYFHDSHVT